MQRQNPERFCLLEIASCPGSRHGLGAVPGAEGTLSRAGAEQNPRQSPWCREHPCLSTRESLMDFCATVHHLPITFLSNASGSDSRATHPSRPCCDLASPVARTAHHTAPPAVPTSVPLSEFLHRQSISPGPWHLGSNLRSTTPSSEPCGSYVMLCDSQ